MEEKYQVPTRWGNHLNGNYVAQPLARALASFMCPHSLGKSFEWKHLDRLVRPRVAVKRKLKSPLAGEII
jgi:hypothetical protein